MSKILVLWDVMLDRYSYWDVKRLNPEWPNPLMNINKEEYRLWWSANVAANIASINWKCDLIWVIWNDDNAIIFKEHCRKKNINFYCILSKSPTITKWRFIENTYHQQLLRVDYEEKINISDKDIDKIINIIIKKKYEIIVISDYNKWIISKKLIKKIKDYTNKNNIKVLVDSKPYNYQLFNDFYLVKPNFKEFCEMIDLHIENTDKEIEKYWVRFVKEMNTNLVITRWNKWASLITTDLDYYHIWTDAQKVFDVTWAWDTFIAILTYAIYTWKSLKKSIKLWNKASWIVIWKVWTAIIEKEELFNKKN